MRKASAAFKPGRWGCSIVPGQPSGQWPPQARCGQPKRVLYPGSPEKIVFNLFQKKTSCIEFGRCKRSLLHSRMPRRLLKSAFQLPARPLAPTPCKAFVWYSLCYIFASFGGRTLKACQKFPGICRRGFRRVSGRQQGSIRKCGHTATQGAFRAMLLPARPCSCLTFIVHAKSFIKNNIR